MNRNIKTTNGLMMHIRRSHGISISGTKEKRRLLNYGYFHGFKGYKQANGRQLPFASFSQICDTISFDSCLKSLLYEKMMFIETALKSVVTQCILDASQSSSINDMLNNVVENYRNSSALSNRTQAQKIF